MFNFFKKLFGNKVDYNALMNKGALIIDVRSPGEFGAGHITGSKNIPLDRIKSELELVKKKGSPVITVCRSGNRSSMAAAILKQAGVEAYNGGAWTSLKSKIQ